MFHHARKHGLFTSQHAATTLATIPTKPLCIQLSQNSVIAIHL